MNLFSRLALLSPALALFSAFPAAAQTPAAAAPNPPAPASVPLGSTPSVTADPPAAHPSTKPVAVTLFQDFTFTDFSSHPFRFAPPAPARQRWGKIILVGDFSVSAGRQFDRSGEISLGHTNIYFGTTAEPSDHSSPAWHFERDLTDYAALFGAAHMGEITLGNIVDSKYTGVIHGSAHLLFYPAAKAALPAAAAADLVLPLPAGPNGLGSADTPAQAVSATYTLPRNTIRVYLDVITESQGDDEFWYLGVPNDLTDTLKASGGTAFREAEITVDDQPAGAAPIFPWIYTGGIDPGLWQPIPGLQTLNFAPYRVNLTPFAGVFSDGRPHTVGVRIFNNRNHFAVAGVLLVYRDPKLKAVRGALTADTLTADPAPTVESHIVSAGGQVSGPVSVTSRRRFTLAGYVQTSAGKVSTKITQTIGFSSLQQFEMGAAANVQDAKQLTTVSLVTQTQTPSALWAATDTFQYPFTVHFSRLTRADGSASQTTAITQTDLVTRSTRRNGSFVSSRSLYDIVSPSDTLEFSAAGKAIRRSQNSSQIYVYSDSHGTNYSRTLTAANGKITSDSAHPR